MKDKDGLVIGTVEMFEDITERRWMESARQEAMEAKSKFTSMVSHELRTPLGQIKKGVSIILDGLTSDINAKQEDLLSTLQRNADRLNHLVNNVLDFQKLDSGRMQFNIQENDMAEAIKEVYDTMKLATGQKGLDLNTEVEQNLPKLKFDRDKIVQVLINLVNNAIKFTGKGGIKIKAKKEESTLHVMIEDTGPGIKEKDIPKLFQTFSQLELGKERKTGCSGLGLAISKEIKEVRDGSVKEDGFTHVADGAVFICGAGFYCRSGVYELCLGESELAKTDYE